MVSLSREGYVWQDNFDYLHCFGSFNISIYKSFVAQDNLECCRYCLGSNTFVSIWTDTSSWRKQMAANIGLAIWRLTCFYETFVQGSMDVLLLNVSAKNPPHRQAKKTLVYRSVSSTTELFLVDLYHLSSKLFLIFINYRHSHLPVLERWFFRMICWFR